MTKDVVFALRNLKREALIHQIRDLVFQSDPKLVGEILRDLDISDRVECRIHREFITCILMFVSSMVDVNLRSCKACIPNPEKLAECMKASLESYYHEAGIEFTRSPKIPARKASMNLN